MNIDCFALNYELLFSEFYLMPQVNFVIFKSDEKFPKTTIQADVLHIPNEKNWDIAVTKALKMIRSSSALTKVSNSGHYIIRIQ